MDEADVRGLEAVEEEAAGIICSLRAGDLAGWSPPWRGPPSSSAAATHGETLKEEEEKQEKRKAWPAVTRGKRSRSSRRRSPSGSGSASAKGRGSSRWARGSPASPLDYSGGSGASTSGGEDGAFCSPPAPPSTTATASTAAATPASSSPKVGLTGGRRPSTLPVPVTPPRPAGQRSRKKMRLPEVQLLVRSLAAENDGLREEMQSLRRACVALSEENGTLETRLDHSSSSKRKREEERPQASGFVLPDLNIPAQDVADGSVAN